MSQVEIKVKGHLDRQWLDWLGDYVLSYTEQEESILSGQVPDQAALYGLIGKLRDLGITLVTINYGGNQPVDLTW